MRVPRINTIKLIAVLLIQVSVMGSLLFIQPLTVFFHEHIKSNLIRTIENMPEVSRAEIAGNLGVVFNEFVVDIYFTNGGTLRVRNLNRLGRRSYPKEITIDYIDGYSIWIIDENRRTVTPKRELQLFSAIAGEQLNSVTTIVRNYQTIKRYASNWLIIDDYRASQLSERWLADTLNRVIDENLFGAESVIVFEEQKYFLIRKR